MDDDCNGVVDDAAENAARWYVDADEDGFGDPNTWLEACERPDGHAAEDADCDDADPWAHPGGVDGLDGSDLNCDGDAGVVQFTGTQEEPVGSAVGGGGDFDGDGYDDILVAAGLEGGVEIAYGAPVVGMEGTLDLAVRIRVERGEVIGDVSADGLDDLLVAYTRYDAGGWFPGAAFLIEGRSGREDAELDLDDVYATFVGAASMDDAGSSVGAAGDFDGDGNADLFVGATRADVSGSGSVYLLLGPTSAGTLSLAEAAVEVRSTSTAEQVGGAVASGDVDGDGLADLVVGAPRQHVAQVNGSAYVVYGRETPAALLYLDDSALTGRDPGDFTGDQVAVGDLDGDGFEDLAVSSYGFESGRGAVDVVAGRVTTILSGDLLEAGTRVTGEREADFAGYALAIPGDVDGDAIDDLVLSAPQEDSGAGVAGAVYVVLGASDGIPSMSLAGADAKQVGEHAGQMAGYTLAGAADFDADGDAEYLVGTWADGTGRAYLVLGGTF